MTDETVSFNELVPVESSNISAIAFSPYNDISRDTGVLTIRFSSGATYDYADVPATVGVEIFEAESVGRYFHANVRGKYEATKRGEEE